MQIDIVAENSADLTLPSSHRRIKLEYDLHNLSMYSPNMCRW
ncbi:hypothetical protein BURPSPAST_N0017 [Burkholderia pseudomallei Pasteur 52237]|uniref:Uncharacterized protein n=1 Tax=Burkholderia pseudomallei 1710a TaxID=320371 RepID=A0A0E1VXE1_BURPE|nr:hypothetical protein BURPSPAST_N0017 [Burkholderia pseudomallei Pasteur 52237]EET05615.1 hypothetical protein BURPS1710A_A0771 [Burkholderia pseudomallei 1710a]